MLKETALLILHYCQQILDTYCIYVLKLYLFYQFKKYKIILHLTNKRKKIISNAGKRNYEIFKTYQ